MFKRKRAALRAAAAAVGVAGLLTAGFAAPAEAAYYGPHLLTVHVNSNNCPWGYSSVKSVQLAVVPSLNGIPYPVAGNHETFNVPGGSYTATIAGWINCNKAWWNWWGPGVSGGSVTTQAYYSWTTRDVWI